MQEGRLGGDHASRLAVHVRILPGSGRRSTLIIGASLGHKAGSKATAVYSRLDLSPVRQSIEVATTAMLAAAKPKQKQGEEGRDDEEGKTK